MDRIFARKRSGRRRALRVLLLGVLALALLATGALVLRGHEVATHLIRAMAERAGIPPHQLEVRAVGLTGLTLGAVQLGGPNGPAASGVEIGWTPWSLLHGRLGQVRVEGLRVNAAVGQGGLVVADFPSVESSGDGQWALPVDRLEVSGARLTVTAGTTEIVATIDAIITAQEGGTMGGRAAIDAVATPHKGAAIRVTADVPEWRLMADAGHQRLAIARSTLALPELSVTASGVEVLLQTGPALSATLSGELRDGSSPARVKPLAIKLQGQRKNDDVVISGRAATADDALVITLNGKHTPASGRGTVEITTAPMKFAADGRQPSDLFPVATAVSRVEGTASARGVLSWGNALTSSAVLALDGVGFDGGVAQVSGLTGALRLASLMPPRTAGAQRLTANVHAVGLPPMPLDLQFSVPGDDRLLVNAATLGFAGGTLGVADLALARGKPVEAELKIRAVDLATALTLLDIDGLSGSGTIEGQIPVRVDTAGAAIKAGRLAATTPGVMRYTGGGLPESTPGTQASPTDPLRLMREALADFHYTDMTLTLERAAGGEGSLLIHLKGANPQVLDNHPFVFNIKLDANFDRLAAILFEGYAATEHLLQRHMRP